MANQTWLGRLFSSIASWFSGTAAPAIHDITVIADNVANVIKNSPVTSVLETGLEMAIPASIGLVDAFKLALPTIVTDLNWAVAEENKTPDQMVLDGIKYLQSIKGTDNYVIQLNSLAAKIQKWLSDNMGLGLTIQQALLTPQIVHNPQLLAVANEVVADVQTASQVVNTVVADTTPMTTPISTSAINAGTVSAPATLTDTPADPTSTATP